MEVQSISEVQIAAEKAWIIISTSIIVVLGVAAIAVLAWWVVENIKDMRREKNKDNSCNIEMLKHSSETSAAAADAGWSGYIYMRDMYNKAVYDYEGKLDKMEEWDLKRINYIDKLRQQLIDNGIEPLEMDKEKAA